MENYYESKEFKKILTILVQNYKKKRPIIFYDGDAALETFKKYTKIFIDTYGKNKDLWEQVSKLLQKVKIDPVEFLVDVIENNEVNDDIILFLCKNYNNIFAFHQNAVKIIDSIKDNDLWISAVENFGYYTTLYTRDSFVLKKYLEKTALLKKLELENKELHEKITELEYAPGGPGYQEAKEHFELLLNN
jgi:hypothetical protein